ncbi:hypothetical protein MN116_002922 [Schistosoma mekongi]|uniref:CAP N-terminal domain-containing protein n=2 Tax=Schistosoma mekongi TaxID=38744 RepID=A0AAE1ZGS3_SCHME|nr:hypothetical protein MN116_002922 [Schistosoma mekongi]
MDRNINWLKYLLCHKHRHKSVKNDDKECVNCVKKSSLSNIKQIDQEGSVKETLSLSTISHTPGAGDGGSASLGDWSTVHQLDGVDTSKVNFLYDGGSSNTSNVLGVSNRVEFCDRLESIVARLERITRLVAPDKPAGLVAFESLIANSLKKYIACSKKLGGSIQSQSLCVQNAFVFVRDLIELSNIYGKPNEVDIDLHLKPLHFKMIEIANFRVGAMSLRKCQLSTIADSILILNWVGSSSALQYVKELKGAAWLNANKVFQYCRSSLPEHVEWIRSWLSCLDDLYTVIEEHFPYGLKWNTSAPKLPLPTVEIRPVQCLQEDRCISVHERTSIKPFRPKLSIQSQPDSIDITQLFAELSNAHKSLRHVSVPDIL